ncbi:S8 family peptidase [Streptomyces specialis]|uniref:S8 family peptidase n=1 Tax=Streptomyces specialis TaxID=498367 RepID=UPI00073E1A3B|nr:S8 family peptidase [Streptomyces specialis]
MRGSRRSGRRLAGTGAVSAAVLAISLFSALPSGAAQQPEGRIQNAGASGAIAGSYIVMLDESDVRAGTGAGRDLAEEYGADITETYTEALNGYAVELSERQARRLAADPSVESVVQNRTFTIDAAQPAPPSWGLDRIDQRALPLNQSYSYPDTAGRGVTAYIIDSGVRVSHRDFGGRARNGYDAVDDDNVAQDGNGHGTHVAATVAGTSYGVAKRADIVAVRVLDDSGSGTTAQVVAGIDWVTRNAVKPAVANMSLGGGIDSALDTAVRNSIASGVTYVVAAGNENANASGYSPARVTEAITVGATTSTDARSGYSNYGSVLDLFAPGSNIVSAWNSGDTATRVLSGTSMAGPHVTGAAALYLAGNPAATPAAVSAALKNGATTGVVTDPGTGSPNRLLATGAGSAPTNATDVAIRDHATAESRITVTGVSGRAPAALGVPVDIEHTYSGDLRVQLVAPDGTAYLLKDYGVGGSTDHVLRTYTVNASSEAANGTWRLRVTDNSSMDTGKIDSWGLRF